MEGGPGKTLLFLPSSKHGYGSPVSSVTIGRHQELLLMMPAVQE